MKALILNKQDVENYLSMEQCIEIMAEAFMAMDNGEVQQPLRFGMKLDNNKGVLGMMPASITIKDIMGIKLMSVFPENIKISLPSHQGLVLLFETETGNLLSIVEAESITAIRTAAVSAMATRVFARDDSSILAILGCGVQGLQHLRSMLKVRDIKEVRVWDINKEGAKVFSDRESKEHNIKVKDVETAKEAVKDADIICTVTAAKEPILKRNWVAEGTHINAVGASAPFARELESDLVAKAKLFTDKLESLLNESGDFLEPKKEGIIGDDHIQGELGNVLSGKIKGRKNIGEITLFKALGLGMEDLAAAHFVYKKAKEKGSGTLMSI